MLDYDYNVFTKLVFKCVFKMIAILQKKGCYKSALEYNKFLLKLNPIQDPCGALLYIDYNAISAQQYDWYMNFALKFGKQYYSKAQELETEQTSGRKILKSILLYPNVVFSFALCKFLKACESFDQENINTEIVKSFHKSKTDDSHEKSIFADASNLKNIGLEKDHNFFGLLAILLYPKMLMKIITITELHKQNPSNSNFKENQNLTWTEMFAHKFFFRDEKDYTYFFLGIGNDSDTKGIEKVIDIYPERNKLLWKSNHINLWLKMLTGYLINQLVDGTFSLDDFVDNTVMPPDDSEEFEFMLPFEPKIHKKMLFSDFSDQDQQLHLNDIEDNDPFGAGGQGVPQQAEPENVIDLNTNWVSLLAQSLMPWNSLPNQNPEYEDED